MADSPSTENPIVTGDVNALLEEAVVPAQLIAVWGVLAALIAGVQLALDLLGLLGNVLAFAELFVLALGTAHVFLYVVARAIYLARDAA